MSKAPDKINVPILNGKFFGSVKEDGGRFRDCDGNIVYLRKDALLEWIHTELDAIEGKEEMSQMELAFTEVIDKIQRM